MAKITTITEPWSELQHYLLGGEYRGPFYEIPTWRNDFYQSVFDPVAARMNTPLPAEPSPVKRRKRGS